MSHAPEADSISNLLTLIITTSPTPSAPSTELLSSALESFETHCSALLRCNVVVVFDTYEQITTQSRFKKGQVTPETAEKYSQYKQNVKTLFLDKFPDEREDGEELKETSDEAEYGSPGSTTPVPFSIQSTKNGSVKFIEAQGRRLGFGLAVRCALRACSTPYVWVHQHDWTLAQDIPILSLLQLMRDTHLNDTKPIKYVCFPAGRQASYASSEQVTSYPELRKLSASLTGNYRPPGDAEGKITVPLTPMFFWHDKPHVASTAHYLERVFPSRLAMLRGAFIEDTIGQKARNQMKEGLWTKWATWLYNLDDGKTTCLRHLRGRTWRGEEDEQRYRAAAIRAGQEKKRNSDESPSSGSG